MPHAKSLRPVINFGQRTTKNLGNKVLTRLGSKKIYSSVQKDILDKVSQFTPDVVLVFKGMEILPSTIKKLREQQYVVINFILMIPLNSNRMLAGTKTSQNPTPFITLIFVISERMFKSL
jgi:hypothetical protein